MDLEVRGVASKRQFAWGVEWGVDFRRNFTLRVIVLNGHIRLKVEERAVELCGLKSNRPILSRSTACICRKVAAFPSRCKPTATSKKCRYVSTHLPKEKTHIMLGKKSRNFPRYARKNGCFRENNCS